MVNPYKEIEKKVYETLTIPGENLKRLNDVDLKISGEISEGFSSASGTTGGGAIGGGFEGGVLTLGLGGLGVWELGMSGGFWRGVEEAAAAAWEWRSKKCWIPNLEGWECWF